MILYCIMLYSTVSVVFYVHGDRACAATGSGAMPVGLWRCASVKSLFTYSGWWSKLRSLLGSLI